MKRIMLMLLTIVMLLNIVAVASAANAGLDNFKQVNSYNQGMFTDVKSADWFSGSVATAYELGLVNGATATTFKPTSNLTVAETIVLACRLHNIYNGGTGKIEQNSQLNNAQNTAWYQIYVDYALANKVIPWTYNDYNAKITRKNFANIIANALPKEALTQINNIANGAIHDVPDDEKIYLLYRAGILTGNDKYGTFNPNSTIQRSEVAAIVVRMADASYRKTFVIEKIILPTSVTLSGETTAIAGETLKWKATVAPSNANQWVYWTSGNPSVATVDQQGNIKTLKAGQTNITATTSNGVKKTVLLKVESNTYHAKSMVPDLCKALGMPKFYYLLTKDIGTTVKSHYYYRVEEFDEKWQEKYFNILKNNGFIQTRYSRITRDEWYYTDNYWFKHQTTGEILHIRVMTEWNYIVAGDDLINQEVEINVYN